jgi:hypothetical protein
MYNMLYSYIGRPRADFELAFLYLFEEHKIINANLVSAEKYRIFQIKTSKSRNR